MTFTGIEQPAFNAQTSYWELAEWQPNKPTCWLLKCKGHPYPHASIVERSYGYQCEAFKCDSMGRADTVWEELLCTIDVLDAQTITELQFMPGANHGL